MHASIPGRRCQCWGNSRELCPSGLWQGGCVADCCSCSGLQSQAFDWISAVLHRATVAVTGQPFFASPLTQAGSPSPGGSPQPTAVLAACLPACLPAGYCRKCHTAGHTTETCSAPPADSRQQFSNLGEQQPAATAAEKGQQGAGLSRTAAPTAGPAVGVTSHGPPGSTASAWPEQGRPVRRGTGALAADWASAAAGTATASRRSDPPVGGRAGMPADVGAGLSDGRDEYGFVSKASKHSKAARSSPAWDSNPC